MPLYATIGTPAGCVDDLSLQECENYDPAPRLQSGRLRFKCPRHGGDNQQSLSVDEVTGKFTCHNGGCLIWGTLKEFQSRYGSMPWQRPLQDERPLRQAVPVTPQEYALKRAIAAHRRYEGSPAQEYARRRGVPDALAKSLSLGYWKGSWREVDSAWLTFPLCCPVTGQPSAVYGRNLQSDEQTEKGRLLGSGLFGATTISPMPEDVLIVEGPFDAMALMLNPALPPVRAVLGSSARPEWFDACRRVTLLLDDDKPGREAEDRLVQGMNERRRRLGAGPRIFCLKSGDLREHYGCKDLGELLERGISIALELPPLQEEAENPSHDVRDFPRPDLLDLGWDSDAAGMFAAFECSLEDSLLPLSPFAVAGRRVDDPAGYYAALQEAIQAGPEGPWAGAVMDDLKMLVAVSQ